MDEAWRRSIVQKLERLEAYLRDNDNLTAHELSRLDTFAREATRITDDAERRKTVTNHNGTNGANHGHA
jgi:hypothetical protein